MNISQPKKEALDKFSEYLSESKFEMYRNVSYAAAGVSLILILLVIQIWHPTTELKISLYSSVVATPLFLMLGSIYEFYILIGKDSYPHFLSAKTQAIIILAGAIACLGLLTSFISLIYSTNHAAIIYFASSAAMATILLLVFMADFTKATRDKIIGDA